MTARLYRTASALFPLARRAPFWRVSFSAVWLVQRLGNY